MKNQYMTQKKKNLSNILIHKNSKTYLGAQNEFAPKLELSWVVSDPMQTCPAHSEGQAVFTFSSHTEYVKRESIFLG